MPITLVMGKILYEDKARIETLQKLGFGFWTIVAKFQEKGWKLCSVKAICKPSVNKRGSATKQLVDEASQFHLGRQCQQCAVICSGALLLSSTVQRPSVVTLCSHKLGRCAVELYHVPHLWYPMFYTSPTASSALQHWTASPMKEGCHWQAGRENRQTWQLANPVWYP